MKSFRQGQRWLSEAEPDLGLGTVLQVDETTVTVHFPASGEVRRYAHRSAPLTRVSFGPGDPVEDHEGRTMTVREAREADGIVTYVGEDADGRIMSMDEGQLSDHLKLNRPQDRLFSGRIDPDVWFGLRRETWERNADELTSPVFGLLGARMGLIPHQLYIAHEVSRRHAPRVLLADEVGLGKTIEAGLILHRLILTGRARRVLIVVPDALVNQWLVEMLRRFNLRFALFDAERFEVEDEDNPFETEQRVICSLDFLISQGSVAKAALEADWDALVVDEAHHLHWSPEESSLEYEVVEALAARTPSVLLLTATPEQLGRAGHFGRLRLLDPARFHDYDTFVEEENHYGPVAALASPLAEGKKLDADQEALLKKLTGLGSAQRETALNRLIDQHGTGRVLYRNTRAAMSGFPKRLLHPSPLPLPGSYAALRGPDALIPELSHADWTQDDPRVAWLAKQLAVLSPDKALVICALADTAIALRQLLMDRHGRSVTVFHEGMEIVERDRAAAYFADADEGAQALICSEIGSEGRNFQFVHHLILFDLPLDPGLLEQRIGRLDRIGQKHDINIHVPYFVPQDSTTHGCPGEVMYRWYHEGLGAFEASCPAAETVHDRLGADLLACLDDPARLPGLITEASRLTSELNTAMEQGRDRLLELHSHDPDVSAEISADLVARDDDLELSRYMERFWDGYGVDHEGGPGLSTVVRPGDHMMHPTFPELPDDGTTVTFGRADALAHEDRQFLTWEHPMVRGAMDMLRSQELGSAAITVLRHPELKAGTLLLELIYVIECAAPPELELFRFLPPMPVRLLLDSKGSDLSSRIPAADLIGVCLTRDRKTAGLLIKQQQKRIRAILAGAEPIAARTMASEVKRAIANMRREVSEELKRLQDLAEVNPNVRPDEMEYLATKRSLAEEHMSAARLRLDALRVVVAR
ncbi:MAG: RNA polymerase-associated protein RapA [Gammaproteobacteria bacterium]